MIHTFQDPEKAGALLSEARPDPVTVLVKSGSIFVEITAHNPGAGLTWKKIKSHRENQLLDEVLAHTRVLHKD